jgi:long-chain acyl-CoA synthetase
MSELGFWKLAEADPHGTALVDAQERTVSYAELRSSSNRLVHALRGLGFERGDALAIVLPNERAFLDAYLAAMQAGWYLTCINFHLTGPEIAYIVDDCGARALLVAERFAEAGRAAAGELDLPTEALLSSGRIEGFRSLDDLVAGYADSTPEDRSAGQTMLYTSGTTGRPKGVRRALPDAGPDEAVAVGALLSALFDIVPGPGAHLVAGPLYHAAPLAFGTGALHLGQTLVLVDKWDPERALDLIERYRITTTHMVPTMFHRLLALPDDVKARYDTSSLTSVIHAAAPCPVDVKRRMIEWWGPVIYEYYAATEGGGTLVRPKEWLEHPGTVGQPFPGATIKILDDDGYELAPGEPGTVYMGSPLGSFEYHGDPEKTAASRHGELFTVGDIGYLDEEGWLFLCDRKADMIISGGVNIYPAEIEAVLLEHPSVGDAAVLGVPDEEWGEQVKAVVEPASGVEPSEELEQELLAFVRGRLASYKCPRSVDFRGELPRYPTGKLYKRLLRDEYWQDADRRI